ncbi:hypothetical protein AAMO2058_001759900, partial [Amorphochlora amoebiformis]
GFRTKPDLNDRADRVRQPAENITYLKLGTIISGIERRPGWIQASKKYNSWWLPVHIMNRTQLLDLREKYRREALAKERREHEVPIQPPDLDWSKVKTNDLLGEADEVRGDSAAGSQEVDNLEPEVNTV